jgi:hypothetical protein
LETYLKRNEIELSHFTKLQQKFLCSISEQDSSESTDNMSIEQIIDYAKNLSYEEKIKLIFS